MQFSFLRFNVISNKLNRFIKQIEQINPEQYSTVDVLKRYNFTPSTIQKHIFGRNNATFSTNDCFIKYKKQSVVTVS